MKLQWLMVLKRDPKGDMWVTRCTYKAGDPVLLHYAKSYYEFPIAGSFNPDDEPPAGWISTLSDTEEEPA